MKTIFQLNELFSFLQNLNTITNIRIAVLDEKAKVVVEYPVEAPKICSLIRTSQLGRDRCYKSDNDACKLASQTRLTRSYLCHAGIMEVITPIVVSKRVIGYVIFAHMVAKENFTQLCEGTQKYCEDVLNLDKEKVKDALKSLTKLSVNKIKAARSILEAFIPYITKFIMIRDETLKERLVKYIDLHYSEDLTVEILAKEFAISRSALFHEFKQEFGCGVLEYITNKRIEEAKKLLESSSLSIAEISIEIGINDYNYFIRQFKKKTSFTPSEYRKTQKSGGGGTVL